MSNRRWTRRSGVSQRGNTLFLVAASMVVILGLSALAIDLVSFYVARSEAQRSADAAALAGATFWSRSGCTSTTSGCSGFHGDRSKNCRSGERPADVLQQSLGVLDGERLGHSYSGDLQSRRRWWPGGGKHLRKALDDAEL